MATKTTSATSTTTGETTGTDGLFDPAPFETPLPTVDGERADKVKLTISGTIELDLGDGRDVMIANALHYGQELTVPVELRITGKGMKESAPDRDDRTVSTFTIGASVTCVYLDELARAIGLDVELGDPLDGDDQ